MKGAGRGGPRAGRIVAWPGLGAAVAFLTLAGFGAVLGLGGFTFVRGEGYSYFLDDPAACVNCHVMRDQFESWNHSSHRNWATCNDCHTPHGLVDKYFTKALSGWNHSVAFTTGAFPEPIVINERNRRIALANCVACHATVVSQMHIRLEDTSSYGCIACHGNVGHQGLR